MQLDKLLREGQAEARTLLLSRLIAADLAELLEDGRLVLWGNSDAGVSDRDLDRPVLPPGCAIGS